MGCFKTKLKPIISISYETQFIPLDLGTAEVPSHLVSDDKDIMEVFAVTYTIDSFVLGEGNHRIVRKC